MCLDCMSFFLEMRNWWSSFLFDVRNITIFVVRFSKLDEFVRLSPIPNQATLHSLSHMTTNGNLTRAGEWGLELRARKGGRICPLPLPTELL